MKSGSAALTAFLATGAPFIGADLYVITLYDGTATYLTSLDRNVTYAGTVSGRPDYGTHTYLSLGSTAAGTPMIQRSKLSMGVGLNPSKIDVEIFATPGTLIENQQILSMIALGRWINASVFVRRAFILMSDLPVNFNTPVPCNLGGAGDGTLIWFAGNIGRVTELGPLNAKFEVRDLLWYLNRPLPKNLFGPGCYHKLFDAGCALDPASYSFTGHPRAGSTALIVSTFLTNDAGVPTAPVFASNPITRASTDVNLPAVTYYVKATYITPLGETLASAEWSLACTPNKFITVASPPAITGAAYWSVYVGTETGNEQRQNSGLIPIGTSWTESTGGIYLSGIFPPAFPTNGYFSLGVLTLTYGTGTLSGQTVSAFVESSDSSGAIFLRVPLPQIPVTADSFSIVPGCDKMPSTCAGKWQISPSSSPNGNLIHFSGFPFTPTPEAAA